jgi:hypothetical protein
MKRVVLLATAIVALTGCAGLRGMQEIPSAHSVDTVPPPGKAAVVFMRPSIPGYTASIFELKSDTNFFAGHVPPFKKLLYVTDPGMTRFLVSGQGADFMDAQLASGKTYYVLVVSAGTGFSLRPVTKADGKDFPYWFRECSWVRVGPEAEAWARQRATQIDARRRVSMPRWEAKPDRAVLRPEDSR